jgi:hypothetical protein
VLPVKILPQVFSVKTHHLWLAHLSLLSAATLLLAKGKCEEKERRRNMKKKTSEK